MNAAAAGCLVVNMASLASETTALLVAGLRSLLVMIRTASTRGVKP